jgi:hypothetical protein
VSDQGLWVASTLAAEGAERYVVVVTVDDRLRWELTPRAAERYARGWLRCAQVAAHDAAVLAQLVALGVEESSAAMFMATELRAGRAAFDDVGTRPLVLRPVVSAATGEPIVQASAPAPTPPFQVDGPAATMHAVHVLEVAAVVDLDDAYRSALVRSLGLNPVRARAAVDDLGRFRRSAAT